MVAKIPEEFFTELRDLYANSAQHRKGLFCRLDDVLLKLRTVELLEEIRDQLKVQQIACGCEKKDVLVVD